MKRRAVVIADSARGLRAAAWLAHRGVAVRVLATPAGGRLDVWLPRYATRPLREVWPGPSRETPHQELWTSAARIPLPHRRTTLYQALGGTAVGLALDLGLNAGSSLGTYAGWSRRRLGTGLTHEVVTQYARRRFARPADSLPGWLGSWCHGGASPDALWLPDAEPTSHQLDQILGAGGDVVLDVEVLHFEVVNGRVEAIETDVGRELIDDLLWVEAVPEDLVDWCGVLPGVDADVSEVWEISIPAMDQSPVLAHCADPALPFWLVHRTPTSVAAYTTSREPVDARALGHYGADALSMPRGAASARRVCAQVVANPDQYLRWARSAHAMGIGVITPWRPMTLGEEMDHFGRVERGDPTPSVPSLGPPSRPWSLVSW
jgi:hypothetical protein